MHETPHAPVHILGGTGKTGRRVADRLAHQGHHVAVRSRSTMPRFDWHDPATHAAALAGADAAYLAYTPDIAFPGAADAISSVADAARQAGVGRLVLLSGRGEPDAVPAEDAVRRSAVDWTVIRCAWFQQNFSEHFLLDAVIDGVIALPAGSVSEPFVDLDDVADVVVAALVRPGHAGRTYELTGPELLTFQDVADQLTNAIGRAVRYIDVTAEEYVDGAVAAGMPRAEAEPLAELFVRVLDGHNAHLTDDVRRLLGRPAGRFSGYATRTAAAGAWSRATVEAGAS